MFNYTNFKSSTIGSPKMRVEIFTLARGARACIESTQFIIMTFFNKLSRLDACPSHRILHRSPSPLLFA